MSKKSLRTSDLHIDIKLPGFRSITWLTCTKNPRVNFCRILLGPSLWRIVRNVWKNATHRWSSHSTTTDTISSNRTSVQTAGWTTSRRPPITEKTPAERTLCQVSLFSINIYLHYKLLLISYFLLRYLLLKHAWRHFRRSFGVVHKWRHCLRGKGFNYLDSK